MSVDSFTNQPGKIRLRSGSEKQFLIPEETGEALRPLLRAFIHPIILLQTEFNRFVHVIRDWMSDLMNEGLTKWINEEISERKNERQMNEWVTWIVWLNFFKRYDIKAYSLCSQLCRKLNQTKLISGQMLLVLLTLNNSFVWVKVFNDTWKIYICHAQSERAYRGSFFLLHLKLVLQNIHKQSCPECCDRFHFYTNQETECIRQYLTMKNHSLKYSLYTLPPPESRANGRIHTIETNYPSEHGLSVG